MTKQELLKSILKTCKETEAYIEEHRKDKNLEKPIQNDLVKTKKAMAYEEMLGQIRKYNISRKENKNV